MWVTGYRYAARDIIYLLGERRKYINRLCGICVLDNECWCRAQRWALKLSIGSCERVEGSRLKNRKREKEREGAFVILKSREWLGRIEETCPLDSVSTRLASFVPSNGRSHNSSCSFLHIPMYIPAQGRDDQIHGKDKSIGSRNCPQLRSLDRSIPIHSRRERDSLDRPIFIFTLYSSPVIIRYILHIYYILLKPFAVINYRVVSD